MIRTDKELEGARQTLQDIQEVLLDLKERVYQENPETFYLLSEPYVDYIAKLRREIEEYTGFASAEESSLPLWIRLRGPHIGEGSIPIELLSVFLTDFRLGVQRIAEYQSTELIRERGRRGEDLRRVCDLRVKVQPGSLKIGIAFPVPGVQVSLEGQVEKNPAEEAVRSILKGASWAVGLESEEIEGIFPNTTERHVVLREVDRITRQIDGDISGIEFSGKFVPREQKIILNRRSSERIKETIERAISPEEVVSEGVIREIDLDRNRFMLRDRPEGEAEEVLCRYDDQLEMEAIEGLSKKVRIQVTGEAVMDSVGKERYINVRSIVILGATSD